MKAVVVARTGGPEVLEVRDVPDPIPQPGEVLVRVEAVGVNFADTMSTRGMYKSTPPPPFISGREFAGGDGLGVGHRAVQAELVAHGDERGVERGADLGGDLPGECLDAALVQCLHDVLLRVGGARTVRRDGR